jgi:hypothetical protein
MSRNLTLFAAIFCCSCAFAQEVIDFENQRLDSWHSVPDGRWELTNQDPIQGNYSLHHSLDNDKAGKDYIYLPYQEMINWNDTVSWSFKVKHGYNPSSANNWAISLTEPDTNVVEPSSDWAIVVGVNQNGSDDILNVYAIKGSQTIKIISSQYNWESSVGTTVGYIIVSRVPDGMWSLWAGNIEDSAIIVGQGSFIEPIKAACFGISYEYSSSQDRKLWVDDIHFDMKMIKDTFAPQIDTAFISGIKELTIVFNEPVFGTKQSVDFVKSSNINCFIDSSIIKDNFIKVFLKDAIENNQHYCFTLSGIQDILNNTLQDTTLCFYLYKPKAFDVVISEIMADPSPSVGLPEFEYLELFNRSDTAINLENWRIQADSKMVKLPKVVLEKDSFLIATYKNANGAFDKYGEAVYCLPDVYFLNNSGANISLADSTGQLVSYCWYEDSWHTDAMKKEGGWSLEWIDKSDLCGGSYSWKSSKSKTGGTPGKKNNVEVTNVDDIKIKPSKILVPNDSTLIVSFTWPVDVDVILDNSLFQIEPTTVHIVNTKFLPGFSSLELILSGHLDKGVTYTLGFSDKICDCNGKTIINTQLPFVLPLEADSNDLVINEVLFNPHSGSTYFVEFYNRSNKTLDIGSLYFARFDTLTNEVYNFCSISEKGTFLMPHKILAICKDTSLLSKFYKLYHTCVVMSNPDFPSLDNKQGRIAIINRQQQIIDQLNYNENWHLPFLSSKEGVSLERLSSEALTNDRNNWYSAAGTYGYATPGYANSQKQVQDVTNNGIISITPEVFSPNSDGVNDFTTIEIKPSEAGILGTIKIFDSNGNMVRTLLRQQLLAENDKLVWNGLSDSNKILPSGIYIIWIRTISGTGKVEENYKVVTLGNR